MSPLRARVENGPLVLDEPTTLPEATVVAGRLRPASAILAELREWQ